MVEKEVKPVTILLGRHLQGLSQSELADKLGISPSKLSQIEHGLKKAPEEMVPLLASVLGFRENFFYEEKERVNPLDLRWRKKTGIDAKERDCVLAWADIRSDEISKLLQDVEIDVKCPRFELGDEYKTPEEIAAAVRVFWGMPRGPVANVTALIEQAGIIIMPIDVGSRLLDGFTTPHKRSSPIIFINKNLPADRMRFSLAHELGHLIMHGWVASDEEEQEANAFARAFLMPERDILPYLKDLRWENLMHLKLHWKVSMAALIMCAESLGAITAKRKTSMFQMLSRNGWRTKEPGEFEKEVPQLIGKLIETHKEELDYTSEELSMIMGLPIDKYQAIYEPSNLPISLKVVQFRKAAG